MGEIRPQEIQPQEIEQIIDEIKSAMSKGDWQQAAGLLQKLRPQDQADLFEDLEEEEQRMLFPSLDLENAADLFEELEDGAAARLASNLDLENLAAILDTMEPDEAADLLGDIPVETADEALAAMSEPEEVRPLLKFSDEVAGGLMTAAEVLLKQDMTVQDSIEYLRQTSPDAETIYYLFVVDDDERLVGVISLRQLVIEPPSRIIKDIMTVDVISVDANIDQEEAARVLSRYDLLALPVVDETRKFLGVITHDDVVEIIEEEATEDIYRLGGVPEVQPGDQGVSSAIRSRLPWLVVNLGTAMASVTVLSVFESVIAQVAVLAAFLPIVGGVSGSAGTQTLTVIVRGLALGDVRTKSAMRALSREVVVGLVNGVVIGSLVALIAFFWKDIPILGLVVGIASLLNLITAALAGVMVPLTMEKLKFDPALASPILVTTLTDSLGYLIYLGIASILIVQLV